MMKLKVIVPSLETGSLALTLQEAARELVPSRYEKMNAGTSWNRR